MGRKAQLSCHTQVSYLDSYLGTHVVYKRICLDNLMHISYHWVTDFLRISYDENAFSNINCAAARTWNGLGTMRKS